jgi:hypothetical protein
MIKFLIPAFLLLSACASVPNKLTRHAEPRFVEPPRTQLIIGCLQIGAPLTFCLCVEEAITQKTITLDQVTDEDFAAAQQRCLREMGPSLQKEIRQEILRQQKKEST